MARLPYVDPATASETVRSLLARLPVPLNIFRMLAHAEASFRPFMQFGATILGRQQLPAALRELVILRVANLSGSSYEWAQHVPIATATGVTEEQIAAVARGDLDAACFDTTARAVLRFATDVLRNVRASAERLAAVRAVLSDREVVETILTVGQYMMVARVLETTGVDLEASAGTAIVDAIRR